MIENCQKDFADSVFLKIELQSYFNKALKIGENSTDLKKKNKLQDKKEIIQRENNRRIYV